MATARQPVTSPEPGTPKPTERRWWHRLTGEMETVGVAPVPDDQRRMSSWRLFIVWLMASASATTPIIALLLFKDGMTNMLLAIGLA